ncbi:MAG: diguanylate cyclase [Zoogloeaceae bacterium]|nr:diguanylate cyclase [Zoogloeaceae bacterium]
MPPITPDRIAMAEMTNPSEIAREALRRLAMSRIPPTPDNYRALYLQITKTPDEDTFPEKSLKAIAAALPRNAPDAARRAQDLEQAVASRQWSRVNQAILALAARNDENRLAWGGVIRDLVTQYGLNHVGLTSARKREALEHVLEASNCNPDLLHRRLMGLIRSWAATPTTMPGSLAPQASDSKGVEPPQSQGLAELLSLLRALLSDGIPALIDDSPSLVEEARGLANTLAHLGSGEAVEPFYKKLMAFTHKLEWLGDDQRSVRIALQGLLQLIIQNIGQLVLDNKWLSGQLAILGEAFSGHLDVRVLDEVERRLKDVIDKQGQLKQGLTDAQLRLKAMLAGFLDRLSAFAESTDEYQAALGECADQIAKADDISELSDVIDNIVRETRIVQETTAASRRELDELRQQVDQANSEITRLQQELALTSQQVRHDPLTGTLNRKGLDEVITREIARARRRESPICLALLDIDNFKALNDTFGHQVGDNALVHLAGVIKESLRPQDSVGRYGGEEFILVLPDTELDGGLTVLTRLQRELTRKFFLADSRKILITFSAGVAQLEPEEDCQTALDRADKAMYSAKRAGKNRVFAA